MISLNLKPTSLFSDFTFPKQSIIFALSDRINMFFGAPPRPGQARPVLVRQYVHHFTDSTGQPATVVYQNRADSTLPPLASFAIYFVNARTPRPPPEDFATGLSLAVRQSGLVATSHFRLELFSLPGADVEACMHHHITERAARGDYTPQLDSVRNYEQPDLSADRDDVFAPSRRPGLPPSYLEMECEQVYHQLCFVCRSASWDDGDGLLELLEYEPISPDEHAKWFDDEELAADPQSAVLPAYRTRTQGVTNVPRQSADGTDIIGIADTICFRSFFHSIDGGDGTEGLAQEATRGGWMHW